MKATVNIIKINPPAAEKLLSSQVKEQRPLRNSWVKTLSADMASGEFRLSADALVIVKGALANGQHRLWAVIESNTTQPFLMMESDDEELYKVLDCGMKRTIADAAHVVNGSNITAIAKLVLCYHNGTLTQHSVSKHPARIEVIDFIKANESELQESLATVRSLASRTQNLAPISAPCALLFISKKLHGAKCCEFLDSVYHGADTDTIAHMLRERFIKMRMGRMRMPTQYYMALLIKAYNAFVTRTPLGVLKLLETEEYPQIIKKI